MEGKTKITPITHIGHLIDVIECLVSIVHLLTTLCDLMLFLLSRVQSGVTSDKEKKGKVNVWRTGLAYRLSGGSYFGSFFSSCKLPSMCWTWFYLVRSLQITLTIRASIDSEYISDSGHFLCPTDSVEFLYLTDSARFLLLLYLWLHLDICGGGGYFRPIDWT